MLEMEELNISILLDQQCVYYMITFIKKKKKDLSKRTTNNSTVNRKGLMNGF